MVPIFKKTINPIVHYIFSFGLSFFDLLILMTLRVIKINVKVIPNTKKVSAKFEN